MGKILNKKSTYRKINFTKNQASDYTGSDSNKLQSVTSLNSSLSGKYWPTLITETGKANNWVPSTDKVQARIALKGPYSTKKDAYLGTAASSYFCYINPNWTENSINALAISGKVYSAYAAASSTNASNGYYEYDHNSSTMTSYGIQVSNGSINEIYTYYYSSYIINKTYLKYPETGTTSLSGYTTSDTTIQSRIATINNLSSTLGWDTTTESSLSTLYDVTAQGATNVRKGTDEASTIAPAGLYYFPLGGSQEGYISRVAHPNLSGGVLAISPAGKIVEEKYFYRISDFSRSTPLSAITASVTSFPITIGGHVGSNIYVNGTLWQNEITGGTYNYTCGQNTSTTSERTFNITFEDDTTAVIIKNQPTRNALTVTQMKKESTKYLYILIQKDDPTVAYLSESMDAVISYRAPFGINMSNLLIQDSRGRTYNGWCVFGWNAETSWMNWDMDPGDIATLVQNPTIQPSSQDGYIILFNLLEVK